MHVLQVMQVIQVIQVKQIIQVMQVNKSTRSLDRSNNLVSWAYDTLVDVSLTVDLSRPFKINLNVKFVPLWNVMGSCYITWYLAINTCFVCNKKEISTATFHQKSGLVCGSKCPVILPGMNHLTQRSELGIYTFPVSFDRTKQEIILQFVFMFCTGMLLLCPWQLYLSDQP